ncbi:Alpha/Beta hydrolase protein [Bombardia bombarda]|uniref:Alpha/Beta hydrolase protein n=1 Tax=Bombardia bombarda TaxID=252184 RepID=A0AA39WGK1_9PEZI|nr:Alpha/Beta hydrolase protein [Bombardia bombarda]
MRASAVTLSRFSLSPTLANPTRSRHAPSASLFTPKCYDGGTGNRRLSHSARLRGAAATGDDPRIRKLDKEIIDEYALLREHYATPNHPIVLAHGLLGFDSLQLPGPSYLPSIPPIHYWRGIREALSSHCGVEVITASVPPSGTIEQRAAKLAADISAQAAGKSVNIIAHSMGGLDARYMISQLAGPAGVDVKSLVTVATPHHGSAFADYLIDEIGPSYLPRLYDMWERTTGWEPGAFAQLTRRYMDEEFNEKVKDREGVRYFSYGAMVRGRPPLFSPFRMSHKVLKRLEGPNDGLVSVESSKWGVYKGTLVGVNHLDLINWSNRLRFTWRRWMGYKQS